MGCSARPVGHGRRRLQRSSGKEGFDVRWPPPGNSQPPRQTSFSGPPSSGQCATRWEAARCPPTPPHPLPLKANLCQENLFPELPEWDACGLSRASSPLSQQGSSPAVCADRDSLSVICKNLSPSKLNCWPPVPIKVPFLPSKGLQAQLPPPLCLQVGEVVANHRGDLRALVAELLPDAAALFSPGR